MKTYPVVEFREFLSPERDEVSVETDRFYQTAGIYSFGRGLFAREPLSGAETRYTKYTRLHAGQFVYSRLFGWEGAVAVVGSEFDGLFVSQEFPTFRVDTERVQPSYLAMICRWPSFHARLGGATKGLGLRRQRVHAEHLLRIEIPLPDIPEQVRLEAIAAAVYRSTQKIESQQEVAGGEALLMLYPALVDAILRRHSDGDAALGDVADVAGDLIRAGEDPSPAQRFIGLEHVERHTGRITGFKPVDIQTGPKTRFAPGDVLYPRLRPYLNKAWAPTDHGLCSVDQYVLRPRRDINAEILAHALRGRSALQAAVGFTSSLQLPRIRKTDLLSIRVPLLPPERLSAAAQELEQARVSVISLMDLRKRSLRLSKALQISVLNTAFAGSL